MAQTTTVSPAFRHLTINDGLSQNTIFCIYQDTRGFIWIGTEDGLNRYDGYEFRIFKKELNSPQSLQNNQVNTIVEDKNRNLIIGTAGGVSIFNPRTEEFTNVSIPLSSSSERIQAANFVTAIVPETDNQFWIATYDGLKLYDTKSKKFISNRITNSLRQTNVQVIYKDNRNYLWVSLRNALRCVDLNTKRFIALPHALKASLSANPGNVRVIKQDKKGGMWFGTEQSGLFYFNPSNNSCKNYIQQPGNPNSLPVNVVRDIFFNNNREVWLATRKGLSILDLETQKIDSYTHDKYNSKSLSHQSVLKIMRDNSGNIWIGTFAGGLNIYNQASRNFVNTGEKLGTVPGLNNVVVSSMLQDKKGNLWIGTEGGGLNLLNRSTGQYEYYPLRKSGAEVSENIIKSLAVDHEGNLWVGAFDGLYSFNTLTKRFTDYPFKKEKDFSGRSQVYTVISDSSGVWAGTNGGGLMFFEPGKGAKVYVNNPRNPTSISGNNISSLVKDAKGNIWIGTLQGLCYFNKKENSFRAFPQDQNNRYSITSNIITCLFLDKKGRLWVGTRGSGLNLYNSKLNRFYAFTEKDGLANNVIRAINEDAQGNIWLSSNKGISVLKLKDAGAVSGPQLQFVKNYTVADGLQSNQFLSGSTYRRPDGQLSFGGINGITSFFPEQIRMNKRLPVIQFTDFLINSKSVEIGEDSPQKIHINESRNITLAYDQAYITFKFSALNFTNPEKNQYAYKLEGFSNDDWHYVGNQRTAIYTNLNAGNYTLLVKASNNDGVWNEEPAKINIRVLPPWYKTWWAYLTYLMVFASLLYFFYYYSYKTAELKNELNFEQMSHEKDQELAQRKLTFFTHISHEIKTPLTLILSPIEKLLTLQSLDNKVQHQLQLIYRNSERLMRLTNQLLDYRKFETGNMKLQAAEGNIVRFTREMVAAFKSYANSKGIELKVISDSPSIRIWFDRDKMEKVMFNLISNSLKFTSSGGYIHVKLSTIPVSGGAEQLKIEVEDNGSGIAAENMGSIFKEFQNYNTSGSNPNGTGLGLSFSKGLVEFHHGSIEVSSVEAKLANRGLTVFSICLPLGRAHLKDSEIIQNYSSSEDINAYQEIEVSPEKSAKRKENILASAGGEKLIMLIVEDNAEVLEFVSSHFEKDFTVHTAVNGIVGLGIATEVIPDIVISDVMMPEMMGTDLCAKLKSDTRTSHIPVILLTAREPLLFKIEGLETGADDYITKPFNLSYLDLKVWNLVESRIKLREKYSREVTLQPTNVAITSPDEKFLEKAMRHIEENISGPSLGVEELSQVVGMSKTTLYRKIKALTNQNTNEFIRSVRLNRAAQLLSQNKFNVNEVAYQVGFSNLNYFRKCFKEQFGSTPTEYLAKLEPENRTKEKPQSTIV